jgi:GNAT superfamily N-acetyltransferase
MSVGNGPPRETGGTSVRPLTVPDAGASAALHREVLDAEFLSRCGVPFLRTYHQAWVLSPWSIALAVNGEDGRLAGVLLGSWNPALHVRHMLAGHGPALAARLAQGAAQDPSLARELLVTRGRRYARGLWRQVTTPRTPVQRPARNRLGEITHVMVAPSSQGRGLGRALLAEAERSARAQAVTDLVLVTPPGSAAEVFYGRLGWQREEQVVSRSGERFVRFRRRLSGGGDAGDEG